MFPNQDTIPNHVTEAICSVVQWSNCPKTARGSSAVSGRIEARALNVASGGDPPRSHCGRGQFPSPQKNKLLISKSRIFL